MWCGALPMPCESASCDCLWENTTPGGCVRPGVGGGVVSGAGEERELAERSSAGLVMEDCERERWLNSGNGGSMLSRAPRGDIWRGRGTGTSLSLSESDSVGFVIMRGPSLRLPAMGREGGGRGWGGGRVCQCGTCAAASAGVCDDERETLQTRGTTSAVSRCVYNKKRELFPRVVTVTRGDSQVFFLPPFLTCDPVSLVPSVIVRHVQPLHADVCHNPGHPSHTHPCSWTATPMSA